MTGESETIKRLDEENSALRSRVANAERAAKYEADVAAQAIAAKNKAESEVKALSLQIGEAVRVLEIVEGWRRERISEHTPCPFCPGCRPGDPPLSDCPTKFILDFLSLPHPPGVEGVKAMERVVEIAPRMRNSFAALCRAVAKSPDGDEILRKAMDEGAEQGIGKATDDALASLSSRPGTPGGKGEAE